MNSFKPAWFTTEDFISLDALNIFHKEKNKHSLPSTIKNYHCLARANYNYNGGKALLQITADDYYKLYINGKYVCQGPSPSYADEYYYNELDISKHLQRGNNVIALHLYYQGIINRMWQSGDNRFGVASAVNGADLVWKYYVSGAYSGSINGYDTDFTENFNSNLWDNNWKNADYDDALWQKMLPCKGERKYIKQPAKQLDVYEFTPKLIKTDKNGCFIDLGQEIAGTLLITCTGKRNDKIIIRYGEELNTDGSVRYKLRAGCTYEDVWTLANGECQFEGYIYKGFRYVQIITGNKLDDIKIMCCHYPFDDDYCKPCFKNKQLEDIFTLCKNTVKYSTLDSYIDCPTREKGQYLGDVFITAHSHILLTGDCTLLEKALSDFAKSSKICKGLMAVAPCSHMQEIADYSLLFGELALMCYRFNGNKNLLEKYYPVIKDIIIYFRQYARPDGLLENVNDKWNLVDWPENLRDGYEPAAVHNVINAYYIGAVKVLNTIENILDKKPSFDYNFLKASYIKAFMKDGIFTDNENTLHASLHSNAFALYFDLVPDEYIKSTADFIIGKGFECGVYVSYFVMKALSKAGRREELLKLITNDSSHGWLNMLKEGATTCFEAWGKEQKWNTSLCHPWASAPVSIILEDLNDYVSCNE